MPVASDEKQSRRVVWIRTPGHSEEPVHESRQSSSTTHHPPRPTHHGHPQNNHISHLLVLALYSISPFHRLSRFPGPPIVAASHLYEACYDFLLGGRYTTRIRAMYAVYRPIVRINPDELHCSDPHFTDAIYPSLATCARDKWQHQLNTAPPGPTSVAGISTVPRELHPLRRGGIVALFSRQQATRLDGEVSAIAGATVERMLSGLAEGDTRKFDVKQAFNCFAADMIAQYAFREDTGFVSGSGDGARWELNLGTWVQSFIRTVYMMNTMGRMACSMYVPDSE
ncbi:hypothetical protein B0T18DRAFT_466160 [Schizothecium vesticola]|uniref:Cytochrome P450 n=1 Tax=Schizothecium vesticola TaxID=314040 RepID=A0AA40K5L1_9PEZI|nr:hypothetical protein B0T18DRAFT_466160 [Schizothecium vesticola]